MTAKHLAYNFHTGVGSLESVTAKSESAGSNCAAGGFRT